VRSRAATWAAALLALATGRAHAQPQAPVAPPPATRSYDVRFEVRVVPSEKKAHVAIHVVDPTHALHWLRLTIDPERQLAFRGDGQVVVEQRGDGDSVLWTPPQAGGGVLRYAVRIDHLRDESSYDARITRDWALVRLDDLVPPVRVRTEGHAESRAHLQLALPERWSAVVPYASEPDGTWLVDRPERRFDRPVGWLLVGRLGVLRERIAGTHVAVGAPIGNGMRRQDLLALLRFTLPALRKIGPLPDRLALVGAGDPMWRGGLSAPNSVYLHAALPLIDEDATSPALHEIVHVMLRARAGADGDGIVEGLAELYSLETLVRARAISRRRYEHALERLAQKGRGVTNVAVDRSTGDVTAKAAVLLHELDQEIGRVSGGQKSLDDVVRALAESPHAISLAQFRTVTERVAGQKLPSFFDRPEFVPKD
jgi:hypothetical protein